MTTAIIFCIILNLNPEVELVDACGDSETTELWKKTGGTKKFQKN